MRSLTLSLILCSCGLEETQKPDTGPDVTVVKADQQQRPDYPKPEKCSPEGNYTFHMKVYENSCDDKIVPELSWTTKPIYFKSYDCGTFCDDGALEHKSLTDIQITCRFCAIMDPVGTYGDIRCAVFRDGQPVCRYSYTCPMTSPDEWR